MAHGALRPCSREGQRLPIICRDSGSSGTPSPAWSPKIQVCPGHHTCCLPGLRGGRDRLRPHPAISIWGEPSQVLGEEGMPGPRAQAYPEAQVQGQGRKRHCLGPAP